MGHSVVVTANGDTYDMNPATTNYAWTASLKRLLRPHAGEAGDLGQRESALSVMDDPPIVRLDLKPMRDELERLIGRYGLGVETLPLVPSVQGNRIVMASPSARVHDGPTYGSR